MSDEPDAIERELEAMTPSSPSLELQARIGTVLQRQRHVPARRWLITVGLAAAACLAIVLVQLRLGRDVIPKAPLVRTSHPTVDVTHAYVNAPTPLREYELALAQSPARVEELLDGQSARTMGFRERDSLRAFSKSDLDNLLNH